VVLSARFTINGIVPALNPRLLELRQKIHRQAMNFWVLVQTSVTLSKYVIFAAGEYWQWSSGKCSVPEFRHSQFPIPELARLELALPDLLRQLDSANSDCRVVESF